MHELLLQFSQQNKRRIPVESWGPKWSRKLRKAVGIEANSPQGRLMTQVFLNAGGSPVDGMDFQWSSVMFSAQFSCPRSGSQGSRRQRQIWDRVKGRRNVGFQQAFSTVGSQ